MHILYTMNSQKKIPNYLSVATSQAVLQAPTSTPVSNEENLCVATITSSNMFCELQPSYQQYDNANVSMQPDISGDISQPTQDCQALCSSNNSTHVQEVNLTEYSFFYKPPNDFQIYDISCKEIPSFELASQLL